MKILTNAKANRKELVASLTELLNEKPRYCFAPTFAYEFTLCSVDKSAVIHLVPSLNKAAAERLATALAQKGFDSTVCEEAESSEIETACEADPLESAALASVTISKRKLSEESLSKLEAVITSKASLLRKVLGTTELKVIPTGRGYSFPWFQSESSEEEMAVYQTLVEKLAAFASQLKRVSATEKPAPNERYAFRCFLLRLGFIGKEYKFHRNILLRNLDGNSAFKSGYDPNKPAAGEAKTTQPA